MMKLFALFAIAAISAALHLSGPMDDRLRACQAANCPASTTGGWGTDADNFQGMGISFETFVAPPTGWRRRLLGLLARFLLADGPGRLVLVLVARRMRAATLAGPERYYMPDAWQPGCGSNATTRQPYAAAVSP